MKKYQIILLVIFALVGALWIIGRTTNAFQYFKSSSKANEPTYKAGSHFIASNLITPKRFDFICYQGTNAVDSTQTSTFVHRICGLPGDIIEIREGDLFVNGVNQDPSFNLMKFYSIPNQVAAQLEFGDFEVVPLNNDMILAPLETIKQADVIKKSTRYIRTGVDEYIKKMYGQPWSEDRFGPYRVPVNTYFVLGDNRNMSMDSRFTGPIKMQKVIATVID